LNGESKAHPTIRMTAFWIWFRSFETKGKGRLEVICSGG